MAVREERRRRDGLNKRFQNPPPKTADPPLRRRDVELAATVNRSVIDRGLLLSEPNAHGQNSADRRSLLGLPAAIPERYPESDIEAVTRISVPLLSDWISNRPPSSLIRSRMLFNPTPAPCPVALNLRSNSVGMP